jgi:hypothetical protein
MSAFAPIKPSKVHFSEYIRSENKEEGAVAPTPAEPVKPATE